MALPASSLASYLGSLERARITGTDGAVLPLMFNPTKLTLSRSASWQPKPVRDNTGGKPSTSGGSGAGGVAGAVGAAAGAVGGGAKPTPGGPVAAGFSQNSFHGSKPGTLAMTAVFDEGFRADGMGDVSPHIGILENWTHIPKDGSERQPPLLTFTWGRIHFVGYLASLSVSYLNFRADGSPVHAEASITLTEEPSADGAQNPTSGGISGRRTHLLSAGDSLQSIAYREYGSAAHWRPIAEANGIDDPLRIAPGTELLIPSRSELTG